MTVTAPILMEEKTISAADTREGLSCCTHTIIIMMSTNISSPSEQNKSEKNKIYIWILSDINYFNMSLLIRFVEIIQKIKPSRFNLNLVELWNRGECGQFPCWPIIIVDLRTVICCTMPLITTTTVRTGKSGTLSQRSAGWKSFYY